MSVLCNVTLVHQILFSSNCANYLYSKYATSHLDQDIEQTSGSSSFYFVSLGKCYDSTIKSEALTCM